MTGRELLFAAALVGAADALGQPGVIDTDFGTNGLATIGNATHDDWAEGMVIQPDGRIVIAGYSVTDAHYFMVARFMEDGTLDTTFGDGGVTLGPTDYYCRYTDLALQADGRIVAAGTANYSPDQYGIVGRYHANGDPDSTFGVNGIVTVDVGPENDVASALAIQADGAIVVSGFTDVGGTHYHALLVRLLPDGSFDPSFGIGGVVTTDVGPQAGVALAVEVQADGRIVSGGQASPGGDYVAFVARYLSDGTMDSTFNGTGIALLEGSNVLGCVYDLAVLADGSIVAAGRSRDMGDWDMPAMWKVDANGQPVSSFANNGLLETPLGGTGDQWYDLHVEPDGTILVSGDADLFFFDLVVGRFSADGVPDPAWGGDGIVIHDLNDPEDDSGRALAVDANGDVIVAGYIDVDFGTNQHDGIVLKLFGGGATDVEDGTSKAPVMSIHPNPAQDQVMIACEGAERVLIHNAYGQLTSVLRTVPGRPVPVAGLPAGPYTISALDPRGVLLGMARLCVQRP